MHAKQPMQSARSAEIVEEIALLARAEESLRNCGSHAIRLAVAGAASVRGVAINIAGSFDNLVDIAKATPEQGRTGAMKKALALSTAHDNASHENAGSVN